MVTPSTVSVSRPRGVTVTSTGLPAALAKETYTWERILLLYRTSIRSSPNSPKVTTSPAETMPVSSAAVFVSGVPVRSAP